MSAEMNRSHSEAPLPTEVAHATGASLFNKLGHIARSAVQSLHPSQEDMVAAGVLSPDDAHRAETGEFDAVDPGDVHVRRRRAALEQNHPNQYN